MTDSEVGQYVRLMCIQANKGFITKKDMLHICKSYDNDVCLKFTNISDDKFANSVLTEIIEQRKAYTESRRNNRKGTKSKKVSSTYVPHMVNINKDVIVNNNIKESISKIELFDTLFNDEEFVNQLSMTHKGKSLNQAFEECYTHHSNAPNPPVSVGEWKQKLNTWLVNTKLNGHSKNNKQSTGDLAAALQQRIMQDALKQQSGGSS